MVGAWDSAWLACPIASQSTAAALYAPLWNNQQVLERVVLAALTPSADTPAAHLSAGTQFSVGAQAADTTDLPDTEDAALKMHAKPGVN